MKPAETDQPVLLFLHGMGDGDQDEAWRVSLTTALTEVGYPSLEGVRVIAPRYAHALKGWDEPAKLPPVTIPSPARDAAKQNRRNFERRMGAVEYRLGRHHGGDNPALGNAILNVVVDAALGLPLFIQVRNYLSDPQVRAQVLRQILGQLPDSGRIVIVGHSLGSVIAADVVRRLPVGLDIAGMVTIGSPLANGSFEVVKLRDAMKEPPTNLSWWVNFWNAPDPVSAHRGVSSAFPWMVDFRIDTRALPLPAHAAAEYLSDKAVAEAVGYALYGSRSKELAIIDATDDIPLDFSEHLALLALRYAHLVKSRLAGDQRDRFLGALRHVQATAVDDITMRNRNDGRAVPTTVARLAFDLSDAEAPLPEPAPSRHITKDDAVLLLSILVAENVIRPFEISIPRDTWQAAMEELTAEMGLGTKYGTDVFAATRRAEDALKSGLNMSWVKWGALGAGAAAIVVATGGLALAAGAGLAGAAAITSALAAFGPGGMIGGLLTAGALVTAGGGGIAYGLAGSGTSAETLEAIVERKLAAEIIRQYQHLDSDPTVWQVLTDIEIEVRREHERLDEFSDPGSPSLKELKRKIESVERALKYLRENDLEAGVLVSDAQDVPSGILTLNRE
ncbi:Alpha/beta hydrolase [Plantibacter sp. RU18]